MTESGVLVREGNWCIHCGVPSWVPARDKCRNPSWHVDKDDTPFPDEDEAEQA